MLKSVFFRWFPAVLVIVGVSSLAAADDGQEPVSAATVPATAGLTFVDEYELTIANLVVHVTDRSGGVVPDLTAEDFRVFQNGEPQQITNFAFFTADAVRGSTREAGDQPPDAPSAWASGAGTAPAPVYLVLYVDNTNLRPLDRNRVLAQTRQFVTTRLHLPAQMMVVVHQAASVEVLQDFTADPEKILAAMHEVRTSSGGRAGRDREAREIIDRIRSIETRGQRSGRPSGFENLGREWSEIFTMVDEYAKEGVSDLRRSVDGLKEVVASLSGLPGTKGILYISNGLPMVPGLELLDEVSGPAQNTALLGRIYEYDQSRLFRQLIAAANAKDVTFFPIDASGLAPMSTAGAEGTGRRDLRATWMAEQNTTETLRLMAEDTGGVAIVNSNDIAPWLARIADDIYTYYSIGYPLRSSGRDRVHEVRVELRDDPSFKGHRVRYRSRLVEKSLETRVQDEVTSSLTLEVDDNPMSVELAVGAPAAVAGERWLLPTRVSFPIDSVALLPEGDDLVGRPILFMAARDSAGRRSDMVRLEPEVRVPAADLEEALRRRWLVESDLLLGAGRHRVAVGVLDPVTRQASYATVDAVAGATP